MTLMGINEFNSNYFEFEAVTAAIEDLCLMGCDVVWIGEILLDNVALHPCDINEYCHV
jgi:hypothetical protein